MDRRSFIACTILVLIITAGMRSTAPLGIKGAQAAAFEAAVATSTTPTPKPPCDCSSKKITCKSFKSRKLAQACFDYCKRIKSDLIYRLDGNRNGLACEKSDLKPKCDPAYPTVCIPPKPPDLDCKDIRFRDFKVLKPDPHKFDGDKDGIGCET